MAIATPEVYAEMLQRAKEQGFAYPAVNVTSSQTLNAAIRGFAEAGSDGIIQASTGGAAYWSGASKKDMVVGSLAFAAYAREVAKQYDVNIALHTDHCPKDKLEGFVLPLLAESEKAVARGEDPIFNSHMWDGSAIDLDENLKIASELIERTSKAKIVLEVEIGAVGGEEDGVEGAIDDSLYTTVADAIKTVEAIGLGEKGTYMAALTFGNVHGVYKPGNVHLRPELLKEIQTEVGAKYGKGDKPFYLVFHGGSGSTEQEIADAVSYGVIKMNIDTDTQYAFTRPVAGHMFSNYDGVLKVDGEVGNKKTYDPRVWGAAAEAGMAARVVEACQQLGSVGTSLNNNGPARLAPPPRTARGPPPLPGGGATALLNLGWESAGPTLAQGLSWTGLTRRRGRLVAAAAATTASAAARLDGHRTGGGNTVAGVAAHEVHAVADIRAAHRLGGLAGQGGRKTGGLGQGAEVRNHGGTGRAARRGGRVRLRLRHHVRAGEALDLLCGRVGEGHLHLAVDEHERQHLAAVHLNLLGHRGALLKCRGVRIGGVHLNLNARIQGFLSCPQEDGALHVLRVLRVLARAGDKYFKNGLGCRFSHRVAFLLSRRAPVRGAGSSLSVLARYPRIEARLKCQICGIFAEIR